VAKETDADAIRIADDVMGRQDDGAQTGSTRNDDAAAATQVVGFDSDRRRVERIGRNLPILLR
jgi:hypothetical protein